MSKDFTLKGVLKTLGPGALYAGAAIGGSHLVMSTQAGAVYGWKLLLLVVLVNFFKYPFFEFVYRYFTGTGESSLSGYKKIGSWAIWSFFIFLIISAIVNITAVTIVSAALSQYFLILLFDIEIHARVLSLAIIGGIILMLVAGRYPLLDKTLKVMVGFLSLGTAAVFFYALAKGGVEPIEGFQAPKLLSVSAVGFAVSLMGWMPTPIDVASFPSLWARERYLQTGHMPSMKEASVDFNLGFVGSSVMAVFFLGLGALSFFGTGAVVCDDGVTFAGQLVEMYTKTIGLAEITGPIISLIALFTMLSTTITCFDAYPRALANSLAHIFDRLRDKETKLYFVWIGVGAAASVVMIFAFDGHMGNLLRIATIASFLVAPLFAYLNFKIVTSGLIPKRLVPGKAVRIWSWAGLIFLTLFAILYLLSLFYPDFLTRVFAG